MLSAICKFTISSSEIIVFRKGRPDKKVIFDFVAAILFISALFSIRSSVVTVKNADALLVRNLCAKRNSLFFSSFHGYCLLYEYVIVSF